MNIKNVTVCGSGVLGRQIAFQTAFHGFEVVVYDIRQDLLDKPTAQFRELMEFYRSDLNALESDLNDALARISYSTNLAEAVKNADLVVEAIPENVTVKKEFYMSLGKLAPAKTIFCTNSSTLLPSMFARETGRPEKFLALHFANQIWKYNTAEVMGHPDTAQLVIDTTIEFARSIGMIPLVLYKEQPGYILNSLQIPFLLAAIGLYANSVADPHIVDKTWMISTRSPMGPFAILDHIGFQTVYNVAMIAADGGNEEMKLGALLLKQNFIDQGKLGLITGEGFYKYPHPAYEQENFLKEN